MNIQFRLQSAQRSFEEIRGGVVFPQPTDGREVFIFLGMPGAGKSTQIKAIQAITNAPVLHMGSFAKQTGQRDEEARAKGKLLSGLDEGFLQKAIETEDHFLILDGYPRSLAQVGYLVDVATRENWRLHVVHLVFPKGSEVIASYDRQMGRAQLEDRVDEERFMGKIERAITHDLPAAAAMAALGIPVTEVSAVDPIEIVTHNVRLTLGLDFASLPWEWDVLEAVDWAMQQTGIDAWPGAGLLYRPFWNGRFGPVQVSCDKDVHVGRPEDIEPLLVALRQIRSDLRWSVDDRVQDTREFYGKESADLVAAMQTFPLAFREGGVRIKDGKLEVLLAPHIEADLRNGIIRLDDALIGQAPIEWQSKIVQRALGRVKKTLTEYPGLRLEGPVADHFEAAYGFRHAPLEVHADWDEIEEEVYDSESGGKAHWRCNLTDREIQIANRVVEFYRTARKVASAPPKPAPSPMPGVLENYRQMVEAGHREIDEVIPTPTGFGSWLHYVAFHATDAQWREWLLNQVRNRRSLGGKDESLHGIITYAQFAEHQAKHGLDGIQKATHQGWELKMHLLEAAFQLRTDHLGTFVTDLASVRMCLRLANLYHDCGKLINVHTPGCHEAVSAKLFAKVAPSWLNEAEVRLTVWLVATHDLFGRLARGISEKQVYTLADPGFDPNAMTSYGGALDPEKVREELEKSGLPKATALQLNLAMWQADVASVAALRWILPVAPILEELVSEGWL